MVAKLVTVGEGETAYTVLQEVDEEATSDDSAKVDRLSYGEANAKTKAQLVDYVSLPVEGDEGESGGTEDA